MPFISPTLSDNYGVREGSTLVYRSLAPVVSGGVITTIGASIGALPPVGVIYTRVSAGFEISPPPGASMLLLTVTGRAWTRSLAETAGGYAHAHAEISLTVEDWAHKTAAVLGPPKRLSTIESNPTLIYDVWAAGLGFQLPVFDQDPFSAVIGRPISPLGLTEHHSFRCWINLVQQADVSAITGFAAATSNVAFFFDSVFVAFL